MPAAPDFDRLVERRGTHSIKWDMLAARYGITAPDALAMWVADMDFEAPAAVNEALADLARHGIHGYFGDDRAYLAAIGWWMAHRHGWEIAPEWVFTTHGLVNGTALVLDAFTAPGDGVLLFTPVYHAFARVIAAAGRAVTEAPLARDGHRYVMDLEAAAAALTGRERIVILCSPHNPGGRVWTGEELRALAGFARRHGLLLVSDEIHHDLVMPGSRHLPMPLAAPDITDRLVMMTASSKTFNLAGAHSGNVIIPDPALRARFAARMAGLGIAPNSFGLVMTTAAYSPAGAAWADALVAYLDANRRLFDARVNAIPGLASMPLEATYLAWVDFAATGMPAAEFTARVEKGARIAANHGTTFGTGGESFLRFNLATPRARVAEAAERLAAAFADLQ